MIKQSETTLTTSQGTLTRSIFAILKATISAHIFLVICFALLALVYTYTKMPNSYLTPCVYGISAMSLIIAGFMAARRVKSMGYLHGALTGLICSIIRILLGYAVFKSYVPTDGIAKTIISAVVISAIGGIAGVNSAGKTKRK